MRKRPALLLPLLLLTACRGESEQSRYREFIDAQDEFDSAQLSFYPPSRELTVLDAERDPETLRFIRAELSAAKLSRLPLNSDEILFHASPMVGLFSGGEQVLAIAPAIDCRFEASGSLCRTHPRHVELYPGGDRSEGYRVVAPDLAEWMRGQQ